jgi:hypothetical protein
VGIIRQIKSHNSLYAISIRPIGLHPQSVVEIQGRYSHNHSYPSPSESPSPQNSPVPVPHDVSSQASPHWVSLYWAWTPWLGRDLGLLELCWGRYSLASRFEGGIGAFVGIASAEEGGVGLVEMGRQDREEEVCGLEDEMRFEEADRLDREGVGPNSRLVY